MARHKQVHKKTCKTCGSVFDTRDKLNRHVEEEHTTVKQTHLKCEECQIEHEDETKLGAHLLVHHAGIPMVRCHVCQSGLMTQS